jgi:hypothetical protein
MLRKGFYYRHRVLSWRLRHGWKYPGVIDVRKVRLSKCRLRRNSNDVAMDLVRAFSSFSAPAYGSPQKISRVVDILVRLTKQTALPAISLSAHGGVARTAAFLSLVESLKTSNG